jgi:hypothetical protein
MSGPRFLFIEFYRNAAYLAFKEDEFGLSRGALGTVTPAGFTPGPALPADWSNMNAVNAAFVDDKQYYLRTPQTIRDDEVWLYRDNRREPVLPDTAIFELGTDCICDEEQILYRVERILGRDFWWNGDMALSCVMSVRFSDLGAKVKSMTFTDTDLQSVCVVIHGYL